MRKIDQDKFKQAYDLLWQVYKSKELTYHPGNDEEAKLLKILNLMDDEFPEVEISNAKT
jgi:hypothetical protein